MNVLLFYRSTVIKYIENSAFIHTRITVSILEAALTKSDLILALSKFL